MAKRLDALLAHAGYGTRSTVKKLIRRGGVTVDGDICKDPTRHVDGAEVRCDGALVDDTPVVEHAILHKPVGYACSHNERESPLVTDLFPNDWRDAGLEWAGRLDRATSGLLVLSSNGQFLHSLVNPRRKVPKRYRIGYRGKLASTASERCAKGMLLEGEDKPLRPAELYLEADDPRTGLHRATMILREGKRHQVRRMIAALGGKVEQLHRDRIGRFDLPDDLAVGHVRAIGDDERHMLLDADDSPVP